MSFQLEQGLFQFDFTDQHAILGVSVNAEEIDIRERYKNVARLLHPDSAQWNTDADRSLAVQLFSRLVTHAYGKLSRASHREEQVIMLELLGKRLVEENSKVQIVDPLCQELYQSGSNFELIYDQILAELVKKQYSELIQTVQIINQISELNLVYLLRKKLQTVRSTPPTTTASTNVKDAAMPDPAKPSPIEGALRRADEYMTKKNWGKAVQELREAITVEPNHARAHALLGLAYLHQQQTTMAKLSINKAIQLNPQDPQVIKAKQEFEQTSNSSRNGSSGNAASKTPKEGLFGGLFRKK